VSILLLAAVHCLKSIKLRLDLTALYIAGVAASSKKFREATLADAAGVVFLLFAIGKPPRPRA
jgi:hypothetical protein